MSVTPIRTRARRVPPLQHRIAELEAQALALRHDAADPAYAGWAAEFLAEADRLQSEADQLRGHTTSQAA